jgi:hypothetical protein
MLVTTMQVSCPSEANVAFRAMLIATWGVDAPSGNLAAFAGAPER